MSNNNFRRLEVIQEQKAAKKQSEDIDDTHYLGKQAQNTKEKHTGRIDQLSFSPTLPYDLAVCSMTRVHIYGMDNLKPKKALTRFTTNVTSATIRDDGQMCAAGSANGMVQLFDINSRAILRSFHDHKTEVHVAQFLTNGSRLLTCSDDHTAKIYDIPTETILHEIKSHTDSIRCGFEATLSPDIIVTGSYDHHVHFTDLRLPQEEQLVLQLDHGAPITSLVMLPSSHLVASAGERYINMYDMFSGGNQVANFATHSKAITDITIDIPKRRLLSVSLDGSLRAYNTQVFTPIQKILYNEALLSVAMSNDGKALAVGAVSGNLYLEKPPATLTRAQEQKQTNQHEFYMTKRAQHFFGGSQFKGNNETDILIEHQRKQKLAQFDHRLKNFQHGPALDAALATGSPSTICALIDELQLRGALITAISNRDDTTLEPILTFILRYINSAQYADSVIKLAHIVLDVYTSAVGNSSLIDDVLLKLQLKLESELSIQRDCLQLIGELDVFLHNNE